MANSFRVDNYRSPKTLSFVVIALLAVQAGCYVMYSILSMVHIAKPDLVLDDEGSSISIPLMFIGLFSLVELAARLATIVVFLIWLHRAYSNLSPLQARSLEFTPGWAVGWWFIPFANLVKPYQVVGETWRESDPNYDPELGFATSLAENPWQLPIWWGSFLIGNIFSNITEKLVQQDKVHDAYPYAMILASVFSCVAAGALIWIVRSVTMRQDERFERVHDSLTKLQPPPPPSFEQTSPAFGEGL